MAETFHRKGAKVVALDISGKQDALVQRLGSDCVAATADVSHSADFERVISETVGRFGRLDILVNTASTASLVGFLHMPAYCASKGAVLMLTKTAALEFAKQGIRVNAICPGPTKTEMTKNLPADLIDRVVASTPIGRYAEASELANAALFLASDLSSYVTGAYLAVDGGYLAI